MDRQADGAALVGDGAGNCLANPPGGVGGELISFLVVEFFGGANQAEAAFLNQVLERKTTIHVFLGNGNNQTQVGLHHLFLGPSPQHQPAPKFDQGHL